MMVFNRRKKKYINIIIINFDSIIIKFEITLIILQRLEIVNFAPIG